MHALWHPIDPKGHTGKHAENPENTSLCLTTNRRLGPSPVERMDRVTRLNNHQRASWSQPCRESGPRHPPQQPPSGVLHGNILTNSASMSTATSTTSAMLRSTNIPDRTQRATPRETEEPLLFRYSTVPCCTVSKKKSFSYALGYTLVVLEVL